MIRQAESVDYNLKKKVFGLLHSVYLIRTVHLLFTIQRRLISSQGNSTHLRYPLLDLLHPVHIFLVLRTPDLDAVVQVGSHKDRGERKNHLPQGGCLDFLTQDKIRAGNL